jgi:hypothetical protein
LLASIDLCVGWKQHFAQQGAAAGGEWNHHFTQKEFLHRQNLVGELQVSECGSNQ